ncbi:MAG: hypothetical protein KUG78_13460 [Kangiellaceae bacterium]|nr:hypothetical protein [Kangiellaceae bacterium]
MKLAIFFIVTVFTLASCSSLRLNLDGRNAGQAVGFYSGVLADYYFSHSQITDGKYSEVAQFEYVTIAEFERGKQRIAINVQEGLLTQFNWETHSELVVSWLKSFEAFDSNLKFELDFNITNSTNFQHEGQWSLNEPKLTFFWSAYKRDGLRDYRDVVSEAISTINHELVHLAFKQTGYEIENYDNERFAYKSGICWLLSSKGALKLQAPFDPKDFSSKIDFLSRQKSKSNTGSQLKIQTISNIFGEPASHGLVKLEAMYDIFSSLGKQTIDLSELDDKDVGKACGDLYSLPIFSTE